jgi:fructose 1,6-bisphosphate aldolase/phosphatase
MSLLPGPLNPEISYFDGPPVVSCAAFAMHGGKMTEPVDASAHPF